MIHRFVQRDKKQFLSQQRLMDVIRFSLMTEKTTHGAEQGKYTFKVLIDANKFEISQAIQQIFKVKVDSVNTLKMLGKQKKFRGKSGRRSSWKKAIVTLAKGSTLDLGIIT